jgi:ABC-type ATPase with predicted acetyltransferase domain
MIEYEFSEHAYDMLGERNIHEDWVKLAIEDPERKERKDDGTVHYIRAIEQYGGRFLRVVVNPDVRPQRIVTVFFDRRIRRSQ